MKKSYSFFFRNGLSLTFLFLAFITLLAQAVTGFREYNDFLKEHHRLPIPWTSYFGRGHFIEATFENWESEFLQMGLFVVATIFLREEGSSESKKCDEVFFDPAELKPKPHSPIPVKKGGWQLALYKHSLSLSLFALFLLSFLLHWYGSWKFFNEKALLENEPMVSFCNYITRNGFWFESFQNWQSEFLSMFAIITLSIYLRQYGSSQSKKVNASHTETGE
ncbi:MAG: DUF6766 family protein [Chitinophagales bacterium]